MIELILMGRPVACNSTKKGKHGFYNPKQKEMEQAIWQLKSQFNGEPVRYAVCLKVIYFLSVPKGTSSVKRKQMLANIIKHKKRPDRGNLDKFLEDVLKNVVIEDDSQIWDYHGQKRWCNSAEDEKTVIFVSADPTELALA